MEKALNLLFGIIISFGVALFGMLFTHLSDKGFFVVLFIIIIPFLGFYFLKSKKKHIAIGVFIGLIPIIFLAITIITLSKLH